MQPLIFLQVHLWWTESLNTHYIQMLRSVPLINETIKISRERNLIKGHGVIPYTTAYTPHPFQTHKTNTQIVLYIVQLTLFWEQKNKQTKNYLHSHL